MSGPVRRIVTGRNAAGQSVITQDTTVPSVEPFGLAELWQTDAAPARLDADGTPTARRLEPPPGGTLFRFFEIAPRAPHQTREQTDRQMAEAFAALSADHCRRDTRRDPLMHTTRSIDYVVILRGNVTLLVDQGEVDLKPFDVVVQRGTNHSWVNHGTEPALLMAVLVDAHA